MIHIEGLRKYYGKSLAVDGLSMDVPAGSVYGFVGPNGAGKTTTMRILATLLRATDGVAQVDGIDVIKNPYGVRKVIGYMPDFFGVYDNLTSMEYLDFYGDAYGIPARDRKKIAENLLELVSLSEKAHSYVDSLSRGMKQRLCLARSLMHDPKVLLLDEPASGMDPRARAEMKSILRTLQGLGKTILVSSHILPELSEMCDYVGIMQKGKLIVSGTMSDIEMHMGASRPLIIKAIDGYDDIAVYLQQRSDVGRISLEGGYLKVAFGGDDESAHSLLKDLMNAGMRIVGFDRATSNLEKIFLEVTDSEAS